jgi:hypothetical protein
MKKTSTSMPRYRDAVTGQFVPKNYADKHPKSTVKESGGKKK